MPKVLIIIGLILLIGGCQTTPQITQLQTKNTALESELREAQLQIQQLQRHEEQLQGQVQELEKLTDVLAVEKSSRVQESSELRVEVRKFIRQQIDDLKDFLVHGDLLDYIGSELVERSYVEATPLSLVDLAHPMPRPGLLNSVTGFFTGPTYLQVKVLRPVADSFVVIWESPSLTVSQAGENTLQLPVTVGVEPGDVIAYVFPESVNVSFDKGTGDTRYTRKDLALGDTESAASLSGANEKRAYSLGVYAILD